MTTETENRARDQAGAEMDSIAEMVAAVSCDYDRLQALKEERQTWLDEHPGNYLEPNDPRNGGRWALACPDEAEELAELSEQAGDCESEDDARQRIDESPISVEVRSGWTIPGATLAPDEFRIMLCWGGPAVRIRGDLDQYRQPCRAWLEYQDWGTPWTEYYGENFDAETLLQYCQQFYFGD